MADSIRQQIIDKVEARFKTIKPPTYETDIGLNVWDAGQTVPEGGQGIVMADTGRDVDRDDAAIGQQDNILNMEAVLVGVGSLSNTNIRKMLADIEKAIHTETEGYKGEKWSNLALRTDIEGDEIKHDHQERKISGALFKFSIIYRTNKGNPYQ